MMMNGCETSANVFHFQNRTPPKKQQKLHRPSRCGALGISFHPAITSPRKTLIG